MKFLIILTIIVLQSGCIVSQPSPFGFNVQYIGHKRYVTPQEEQKRNFCENFWCTNDAFYLFTKSSQYLDQDPCVDFKNFTVGTAWEIDVVDYRTGLRGFGLTYSFKFKNRIRKILSDKINIEDNRVVRILKNTFQKCLKTGHLFRHIDLHKEIFEHLSSLGGSPYLNKHMSFNPNRFDASKDFKFELFPGKINFSWNEGNFNISRTFEEDPIHAFEVFLNYEFTRCTINNLPGDFLCFSLTKSKFDWNEIKNLSWTSYEEALLALEDSHEIAPQFKKILRDEIINPAINNLRDYQLERIRIKSKNIAKYSSPLDSKSTSYKINSYLIRINNIKKWLPELEIDWMKVINGLLLEESKISNDSTFIVIHQFDLLSELVKNLFKMEKEVIADTFVLTYFYSRIRALIKNFHNRQIEVEYGPKHAIDRWDTCYGVFIHSKSAMKPAVLAFYETQREKFDSLNKDFNGASNKSLNVFDEAKKFITEAVDEAIKKFIAGNNFPIKSSLKILKKLKSLEIVIGVTNKTLKMDELDNFYKDLNLNGTEGLFESIRGIEIFSYKLKNEGRESWRVKIRDLMGNTIEYQPSTTNVLYIPPEFIIYPSYHPLRPRFFNMATIFKNVLYAIALGVNNYFKSYEVFRYVIEQNPTRTFYRASEFLTGIDSPTEIAYFHYKRWLQTHEDLQIGANYLTNPQLYLVANAVTSYTKYISTSPEGLNEHEKLHDEYLHVIYKVLNNESFYDAFKCKPTDEEKEEAEIYDKKYNEWSSKMWSEVN